PATRGRERTPGRYVDFRSLKTPPVQPQSGVTSNGQTPASRHEELHPARRPWHGAFVGAHAVQPRRRAGAGRAAAGRRGSRGGRRRGPLWSSVNEHVKAPVGSQQKTLPLVSVVPANVRTTSLASLTAFSPDGKFMPSIPNPYTLDSAKLFLHATRRQKNKYGTHLTFAVRELPQTPDAPGRLVGSVGVGKLSDGSDDDLRRPLPHKLALEYWLVRRLRGRGVMATVVREFISQLFASHPEVRRVYGKAFTTNAASIATLRRAGLKFEGILRDDEFHRGKYVDCALYAIVRTDEANKEE
ncbi:MAG: acyl-CoA N-acyltransferase, partial [Olpidium bornovanus]